MVFWQRTTKRAVQSRSTSEHHVQAFRKLECGVCFSLDGMPIDASPLCEFTVVQAVKLMQQSLLELCFGGERFLADDEPFNAERSEARKRQRLVLDSVPAYPDGGGTTALVSRPNFVH